MMHEQALNENAARMNAAIDAQDWLEALKYFDRSIEIAPELMERADVMASRTSFLLALGRKQDALDGAERAIALGPSLPFGYVARAHVHRHFKELKKADEWITKALDCPDVTLDALRVSCQISSELRNHAVFGVRVGRLLAKDPVSAETNCLVAQHQFRNKEYSQAADHAQHALAVDPEHWRSYLVLAHVYIQLGKTAEAVQAASSAARLQPTNIQAQHALKKAESLHRQSAQFDKVASVVCAFGTKSALIALVALFVVSGAMFIAWENWYQEKIDDMFVAAGPLILGGVIFSSIHQHLAKMKPDAEQFFIDPDY